MSSRSTRRVDAARYRYLIVAAVVLLIGLPTLAYPFGRDQGEYAYIATAALSGKAIYRDVFNVKPPLTHVLHAVALLLFGRSMLAIRLLDLLWQAATALLVMRIGERTVGRKWAGPAAAVLYTVSYYSFDYWNTAQTDGFLTLPTALSVWAFMAAREEKRPWAYLASGAALGVAALFKYPIAALLPMLALLALLPRQRRSVTGVASLVAGLLVPVGLCLGALAAQGALGAFITTQTRYVPQYTGSHGSPAGYLASALLVPTRLTWANLLLWPGTPLVALSLYATLRLKAMERTLPVFLWWLAATASYVAQGKGFMYHVLPLLAPQAILAAVALSGLLQRAVTSAPARFAGVALAQMLVLVPLAGALRLGYPLAPARAMTRAVLAQQALSSAYEDPAVSGNGEPGFSLAAEMASAAYIRAHTQPGDTVFVWGFEPTVYFLSGRACASRFLYNFPLYADWNWPELREQLAEDLGAAPPAYIVVVSDDALLPVIRAEQDSASALAGFPWLAQLIETQYEPETHFENLALYRRR